MTLTLQLSRELVPGREGDMAVHRCGSGLCPQASLGASCPDIPRRHHYFQLLKLNKNPRILFSGSPEYLNSMRMKEVCF